MFLDLNMGTFSIFTAKRLIFQKPPERQRAKMTVEALKDVLEKEFKTPRKLLQAINELDRRYEKVQDVINDKTINIHEILKRLKGKVVAFRKTYKNDPNTLKLLSQITDVIHDLEKDLKDAKKDFAIDTHKTKVFYKGKDSDKYLSPQEKEKKKRVSKKYKYSPERFKSKNEYLAFLAKELTSLDKINEFLKYMYRYTQEHEQHQQVINTAPNNADTWLNPKDFVTNNNTEGRFSGDCEDIAILFERILSLQGKKPFFFIIPGHALAAWFEKKNGKTVVYIIDTTSTTGASDQASCKKMEGEDNESAKDVFSRLLNSFSRISDAKAKLDVDQINLGFIFDDGVIFNIPANFDLSQKYQQIKLYFEKRDYKSFMKMLDEAIIKQPTDIQLRLAKLQFQVLSDKQKQEITKTVQYITSLIGKNTTNKMALKTINQTAYFLSSKGFKKEAVSLMEGVLQICNVVKFDINMNDTLSDLHVSNNDFEKAYQNDLQLIQKIVKIREEAEKKRGERAIFYYLQHYGVMNVDSFFELIESRFNSNEKYKKYVLSQPNISETFLHAVSR